MQFMEVWRMAKPKSSLVHDQIVGELEKKLQHSSRSILKEHEYKYNGDHEADLLVFANSRKYAYAIEVKTTNHKKARKKAISQLEANEAYINGRFKIKRIYKLYAYKATAKQRSKGKKYNIIQIK